MMVFLSRKGSDFGLIQHWMTRWDREGIAAPTGFGDVKQASALPAQVIDRHKKTASAQLRRVNEHGMARDNRDYLRCRGAYWAVVNEPPSEPTRVPN